MQFIYDFFNRGKEIERLRAELHKEKQARLDDFWNTPLKNQPPKKISVPIAGFDSTDDEPVEAIARQEYVKNVDFFMDAVLNTKLKCSIADIRELLSNVSVVQGLPYNMQRSEYDWYLRGMSDHAQKMYEWGMRIQGERRAALQDKENENGSI